MKYRWLAIGMMVVGYCATGVAQQGRFTMGMNPSVGGRGRIFIPNPDSNACLSCHLGIESIRPIESGMMQEIFRVAAQVGYPHNDCIVCHGGNPDAANAHAAHRGTMEALAAIGGPEEFYPNPASVWINHRTCGMCHDEQVKTQFTSLMFTEAGKIQGTTWGFGGLQGYNHDVANVGVRALDVHQRLGSRIYRAYMDSLKVLEPQVFPDSMRPLPPAPTAEELEEDPRRAVYTYLRTECQRCHTGVKGHQADGDYRGAGCAACHIPYSNRGLYEGGDPTIDKQQKGKMLVHRIQGTRDAVVEVHGYRYTGIPTKTCTACHNRGRRIGVSYEGLMETSYASPFMSNGGLPARIHKKHYLHLQSDVHLQKGMFCQDCHTSLDVHGSGDLVGAIQGAVEIECTDCHGTPEAYPWELPIGYGDEIAGDVPREGIPRGVSDSVPSYLKKGWVAPPRDGYLLTSRGNPLPHVVRDGNDVIVHTAGGRDIRLTPLKGLVESGELSPEGRVAMVQVGRHIDRMECYACHSTWAPQCYGCHIRIDYSKPTRKVDWVEVASHPDERGLTPDMCSYLNGQKLESDGQMLPYLTGGEIHEERSYLRWEDPPLVINGEHRVSPAIPGCQTTVTVIGKDGKVLLHNHVFRIPNVEGAGPEGQRGIDIAPLFPHTTQRKARSCESCHNNPKAMGFGIGEGKLYFDPSKDVVMDLRDASGHVLPAQVDTHFNAIDNLNIDWSRFLDERGRALQTVGHHFSGSRPFSMAELAKLDRRGVCLSCHATVPDGDVAVNLMAHIGRVVGLQVDNTTHQGILHKLLLLGGWVQVGLLFISPLLLLFVVIWLKKKIFHRST